MQIHHISAAIDTYRCIPGINEADHAGVTEDQIVKLEGLIRGGYRLPAAYKEFLMYAGNAWKKVFQNTDMDYETAWRMAEKPHRSWPGKFQRDEEDPRFPDNVFLINEYLSGYFAFIKLDEGEDPPVYAWRESMEMSLDEAEIEAPSFSVFLHALLADTRYFALRKMQGELARKTGTHGPGPRTPPIDIPKPEPGIQAAIDTFNAIPGMVLEPRVGCTQAEIDALEACVTGGRKLPFAYREFLAYAGHQWGALPLSTSLNHGHAIAHAQDPEHHWIKPYLDEVVIRSKFPFHGLVIGVGEGFFTFLDYTMCDDPGVSVVKPDDSPKGYTIVDYSNFAVYLHHMAAMEKLAYDRRQKQGG